MSPAVTQQPLGMSNLKPSAAGPTDWVGPTMNAVNCPPGLEYLASVDHIFVKQLVELLEAITGFETQNKYQLVNTDGQRIYAAFEESGCCARMFLTSYRPFVIHLYDSANREVMRVIREFKCCTCACCEGCGMRVDVEAPVGTNIGFIQEEWACGYSAFAIKSNDGQRVLSIRAPWCRCECVEAEFPGFMYYERGSSSSVNSTQ